MRNEVSVKTAEGQEFTFDLENRTPMRNEEARLWLDAEYQRLGCALLRPTGKLLLADKVLVIARDAGAEQLADPQWGPQFASAASGALGRPAVHIDLTALSVTF